MRDVTDPVAVVRLRWLGATLPASGSTMGATAVFVMGGDAEVLPNWPSTGQHYSLLLTFTNLESGNGELDAMTDFLDRDAVADLLREDARLFVMAGPTPIAEGRITSVLWKPDP